MKKLLVLFSVLFLSLSTTMYADELSIREDSILKMPRQIPNQFAYDSGVNIAYPEDGVKGVYVSAYSAGGTRMETLTELLNDTSLNSMVIDVKEDSGSIMVDLPLQNDIAKENSHDYYNPEELMKHFEENAIYPIARVVVFKDSRLAEARPDLSFTYDNGQLWQNGRGEKFVNPFLKEVWDYNIDIAIEAAKLGFKDIQFDYIRFAEGFEHYGEVLNYEHGDYDLSSDSARARMDAINDFLDYAQEKLKPYGVNISADVFGYAATMGEAHGIGQNFAEMSERVDVISSMIYPSHWGPGLFGLEAPDTQPYEVVDAYMEVENEILQNLDSPPISRPWLQDFTASYLGAGNYLNYGPNEIEAQIRALNDNGVEEFLMWDASNTYTEGTDYSVN